MLYQHAPVVPDRVGGWVGALNLDSVHCRVAVLWGCVVYDNPI